MSKAKPAAVVDATTLKMTLGTIGERVRGQDLVVTRHGATQAVLVSPERYAALLRLEPVKASALADLEAEFDAMLERMQSPAQEKAMNGLMDSGEGELNHFLHRHYDANPLPSKGKLKLAGRRRTYAEK